MIKWLQNTSNFKIGLIIFIIGFSIYSLSIFNGFVADDNIYILQNPQIINFNLTSFFLGSSYYTGDINQLSGIYYKPIFTLITSLLFNISNGSPYFIRFVQIIIHLTNSFLLFLFFKHFFSKNIAFFLAIIFLIHPGNTESVIYIADLQDVLFFLFGISALLLILKNNITLKNGIIIGLLILSSLLSKESGILFIPTSLILASLIRRRSFQAICWINFAVFLTYLFMRLVIAHVTINHQSIAPIMDASFTTRIITIPKIIYSYLILFAFPKNLSWAQHWVVNHPDYFNFYLPLTLIFLILTFLIYLYRKFNKDNKIKLLFFLTATILGFGLHSQIIPLDFTFAERWFYFPFMGLLGVTGTLLNQINYSKQKQNFALILVVLIIVLLSIRTFIRTLDWKNDYTLSSHDLQVDPNSFALENNFGFELIKKQQYNEAKDHLENSIRLYPAKSNNSAYNNLAFTYAKLKQPEKSIEIYQQSLALGDYYITYQNYIAELIRQQKYEDAEKLINGALVKYPNNPKIYLLQAVAKYQTGDSDGAISSAQKANRLTPGIGNFVLQKINNKEQINL